jgi:hypothetical protein
MNILAKICYYLLHVHMENTPTTGRIFMKFYIEDFQKSVEIQVSLKSDENKWHVARRPMYICDNVLAICSWNGECLDNCFWENQYRFYVHFFSPENCAVYKIAWKKYDRARQATDDNIKMCWKEALCMPDRMVRIYTSRIINGYWIFYDKHGCANASRCYALRTFQILLKSTLCNILRYRSFAA